MELRAAIVFVNYTRSPEAKYPVSLEQAYGATKWVAENGQSINVDPTRLAVAGDSAGGNLATAVTLLAKERGGPNSGSNCSAIHLPMLVLTRHLTWNTRTVSPLLVKD